MSNATVTAMIDHKYENRSAIVVITDREVWLTLTGDEFAELLQLQKPGYAAHYAMLDKTADEALTELTPFFENLVTSYDNVRLEMAMYAPGVIMPEPFQFGPADATFFVRLNVYCRGLGWHQVFKAATGIQEAPGASRIEDCFEPHIAADGQLVLVVNHVSRATTGHHDNTLLTEYHVGIRLTADSK